MKKLSDYEYYKTDLGVLYCGDAKDILKLIDPGTIDLCITSPPYDNLRDYDGYSFDFNGIADNLYKVIGPGGVCVWIVGDATIDGSETGSSFKQALYFKEIGFNLHDTMIWEKRNPPVNSKRYEPNFEYMFILVNGKIQIFNPIKEKRKYIDKRNIKFYHRNKSGQNEKKNYKNKLFDDVVMTNIWKIDNRDASEHPAIFPENLVNNHIVSWSNKGNIVLDIFAGSGTTLKMAEKLNRKWIGIEISEKYCEIAKQRIKNEADQFKLL